MGWGDFETIVKTAATQGDVESSHATPTRPTGENRRADGQGCGVRERAVVG
jgi:hypothetical protein